MIIDTHAHLDMNDFEKDLDQVIERALDGGLAHIITVGIDLESTRKAVGIAIKNESIYATVGYHPHNADECGTRDLEILAEMACEPKVVAWGEIGLDFFRRYSAPESQRRMFIRQLDMAGDLNLPVIIHDREAHEEVLAVMKKRGKGERKGVIHCFSGDTDLAMAFIDLGYYISIPGTVTYKKADQIKAVASRIPLGRLLVETDAPFLAPVPKRGKRNEPFFVNYTAREIAKLRNMKFEDLAVATTNNAKELFTIPG